MELKDKVRPEHTALLVIDLQNDFFRQGGVIDRMGHDPRPLDAIIDPLRKVIERARAVLPLVVWTKQTRHPYLRGPVVLEQYERVGMLGESAPDALDFYRLLPADTDVVIEKHKYSAFVGTALDSMLRAGGIKTVVVTGVAANVCVESTARHAFMLDYHVVVPSDLVAGVNDELKAAALTNIDLFFGQVVTSADLLAAWEAAG